MSLFVNVLVSLAMLVGCLWLVWPGASPHPVPGQPDAPWMSEQDLLIQAYHDLDWHAFAPILLLFFVTLAGLQFVRSWRWRFLLRPLGVEIGTGPVLAVSAVGFMGILALPARLGEFVRPALICKHGDIEMTAALGTIAVERVVDGLLVALMVFASFSMVHGPDSPAWMMNTAYLSLAIFSGATLFVVLAIRSPEKTVRLAVLLTLTPRFAPRLAASLENKLHSIVSGLLVVKQIRLLAYFLCGSLMYWIADAALLYILALGFDFELSPVGAVATLGLISVGIALPNAPALAGQYQWFTMLGLSLTLSEDVAMSGQGLLYAIFLHGLQVLWYIGMGAIALMTPYVSISHLWQRPSKTTE